MGVDQSIKWDAATPHWNSMASDMETIYPTPTPHWHPIDFSQSRRLSSHPTPHWHPIAISHSPWAAIIPTPHPTLTPDSLQPRWLSSQPHPTLTPDSLQSYPPPHPTRHTIDFSQPRRLSSHPPHWHPIAISHSPWAAIIPTPTPHWYPIAFSHSPWAAIIPSKH